MLRIYRNAWKSIQADELACGGERKFIADLTKIGSQNHGIKFKYYHSENDLSCA